MGSLTLSEDWMGALEGSVDGRKGRNGNRDSYVKWEKIVLKSFLIKEKLLNNY